MEIMIIIGALSGALTGWLGWTAGYRQGWSDANDSWASGAGKVYDWRPLGDVPTRLVVTLPPENGGR
jgi:hypothetical protein